VEPGDIFWSTHYLRHNQRRQEHLAALGLPLAGRTVLEVGAGIGDHTSFFLDRNCEVIVSEARDQNLEVVRARYPQLDIRKVDLDAPPADAITADIVYCYGTLYHLHHPATAISWMSRCAQEMLLIETCVAAGPEERLYPFDELAADPDNAVSGHGCRPTRGWVRRELRDSFAHVYMPVTQPSHEEFPLDWTRPELASKPLIRAVFIGSRRPLDNHLLTEELPMVQTSA
jgi:ubiquinone/menaquinone biosynthesis C-methylase UbiE